jgi:hypothetical protein
MQSVNGEKQKEREKRIEERGRCGENDKGFAMQSVNGYPLFEKKQITNNNSHTRSAREFFCFYP